MGVNMGVLPTKGLTLPFMSYGGTGIVINCVAVAVLLRIDAENRAGSVSGKVSGRGVSKGVGRT
jgi:cell division protein FtsW